MSNINVATAPKTATFQMRINPEIKQEAENVFSNYGLSLTEAFNIFLQQLLCLLIFKSVPFSDSKHKAKNKAQKSVLTSEPLNYSTGLIVDSM